MSENVSLAIKKETLVKYSMLECSDCRTNENLMARFEDTEIILCKSCIQGRLDVFKEDEQEGEVDTWENHVKEDHINTWRKNA